MKKGGGERTIPRWLALPLLAAWALSLGAPAGAADRFRSRDSKECLDCHQDTRTRLKLDHAHEPFRKKDCESCHKPHGILGSLNLRADGAKLCFICHDDLASVGDVQHPHGPVGDGDCLACHDPHASGFPALLPAEDEAACFSCHEQDRFARAHVHEPVEKQGCRECHDPHGSNHPALLPKPVAELCLSCHQGGADLSQVHGGSDVTGTNCATCHDPHGSSTPELLLTSLHVPVADMDCESCHSFDDAGAVVETADAGVCLDCHDVPG
ncbi:MAG TPA: cytochrome c3 family protein, partial [bacterium]|nr:cytochrome c3 family protein [bacterium]